MKDIRLRGGGGGGGGSCSGASSSGGGGFSPVRDSGGRDIVDILTTGLVDVRRWWELRGSLSREGMSEEDLGL